MDGVASMFNIYAENQDDLLVAKRLRVRECRKPLWETLEAAIVLAHNEQTKTNGSYEHMSVRSQ